MLRRFPYPRAIAAAVFALSITATAAADAPSDVERPHEDATADAAEGTANDAAEGTADDAADDAPKPAAGLDAFAQHLAGFQALLAPQEDPALQAMERVVLSMRDAIADPQLPERDQTCARLQTGLDAWHTLRATHPTPEFGGVIEVRAFLDLARTCNIPALHDDAMLALGRILGHQRATEWAPSLQQAIIRYTNRTPADVLAHIDARSLIPLFEVLIDIEDFHALERLTGMVTTRIADAQTALDRYKGFAQAQPKHSIRNDLPAECRARLDGESIPRGELKLRAGTWRLRCEGDAEDTILTVNGTTPSLRDAPRLH